MPITPFMGVRISWLMLARKSLLAGFTLGVFHRTHQFRLRPFPLGDIPSHAHAIAALLGA